MATSDQILFCSPGGRSVGRSEWEPRYRVFVSNQMLVFQNEVAKPWRCALSWGEIGTAAWLRLRCRYRTSSKRSICSAPTLFTRIPVTFVAFQQ